MPATPSRVPESPSTDDASASVQGRRTVRLSVIAVLIALVAMVSSSCTPEQIATTAINNHFASADQACAKKIVARESNYQAAILSPDWQNIGLFQINYVHAPWIKSKFGYEFGDLVDADKNAEVARALSDSAKSSYGDRWQPWRLDGKPRKDGSCAA